MTSEMQFHIVLQLQYFYNNMGEALQLVIPFYCAVSTKFECDLNGLASCSTVWHVFDRWNTPILVTSPEIGCCSFGIKWSALPNTTLTVTQTIGKRKHAGRKNEPSSRKTNTNFITR